MDAKQAIESSMNSGLMILTKYVSDLDDADLMERPGPGCNTLAWQLGHLISSETFLVNLVAPGQGAELPAGFAEKHAKDKCDVDDPAQFCTRDEYLQLYEQVRATVGAILLLIASHPVMHAGQFVPVRRRKEKPIVI
jgi:hypothetical protein